MFSPARISNSSRKAVRGAQTSVEAAHSAQLLSSRKVAKKKDDDNEIRSSLSEVQEKYLKCPLREHKQLLRI